MGPACPSRRTVPPPGSSALKVNGNCEMKEKFLTVRLTFLYACGWARELWSVMEIKPSLMLSFPTDKLCNDWSDPDGAGCFCCDAFPPRLEKFHLPDLARTNATSGCFSVRSVT